MIARTPKQAGRIKIKKEKKAKYPSMAKISMVSAINAAEKSVPGKALEAELESEDGYLVYEVEIVKSDSQIFEVKIDAGNGKILEVKRETEEDDDD